MGVEGKVGVEEEGVEGGKSKGRGESGGRATQQKQENYGWLGHLQSPYWTGGLTQIVFFCVGQKLVRLLLAPLACSCSHRFRPLS